MNTVGSPKIHYLIVNTSDAGSTFRKENVQNVKGTSVRGVDITEVVTFYPNVGPLSLAGRANAICNIVAHFFLWALTFPWPQTRAYHMQQISLATQSLKPLSSFAAYQRRAQEGIQRLGPEIKKVSRTTEPWEAANVAILYSEEGKEIARLGSKAYYEKISAEKQLTSGQLLHWIKGGEEASPEGMSEQHQLYYILPITRRCAGPLAGDLYLKTSLPQIALEWENPSSSWHKEQDSKVKQLEARDPKGDKTRRALFDALQKDYSESLVKAIANAYRDSSGVFDPSLLFGRPNPSANIHKESFIFKG